MTLKEDLVRDIVETFLNTNDFAEVRTVAGRRISCVFYEENESDGIDAMGTSQKSYILQAAEKELPRITVGDRIRIDGELWVIQNCSNDYGMAVLKLSRLN